MSSLENLYEEFASLGGNAELLKTCNPSEQAVRELVAFMRKVGVRRA